MSPLVGSLVGAGDVGSPGRGSSAFAGGGVPSSGRKQAESAAAKTQGHAHGCHPASKVSPYGEAYQERTDITAAEIFPSCVSHRGCFPNGERVTQRYD